MLVAGEGLVTLCVPLVLQAMQRVDQRIAGLDRVGAAAGHGDVGGLAAHFHLKPHHADLCRGQPLGRGLGNDGRVTAIAPLQTGQRAVARALLLHHGLQVDLAAGSSPSREIASMANRLAARPAFMSPAPRPYIHPPSTRGSNGGVVHMSSGPVGTTSMWPLRISERPPAAPDGRRVPTTFQAFS
jgi:hypothetical protein